MALSVEYTNYRTLIVQLELLALSFESSYDNYSPLAYLLNTALP